jgi:para-nitrobenzyl esterase
MPDFNRRDVLSFGSLGLAGLLHPSLTHAAQARPVAATREGDVRGVSLPECDAFLGIPFAAPPVGPLRFRAARPASRRNATFEATSFAAAPEQASPPPGLYGAGTMPVSEDCLALNIWRPRSPGPHPVYVWVHGGGNVAGSSRMPVFDGSRLARHGIVCVTISYRVGVFGFLDLGQALGPDYAGSGNNGLGDILAALRWVRDNIAGFGGAPHRVTIGGQSAGAKDVCSLLAMPSAKGLFHGAIIESGGAQTAATPDTAAELTQRFIAEAGAGTARALLDMTPAALLAAQGRVIRAWRRKYPFRAVIDGVHLHELPLAALTNGHGADVPILIGTARDEIAFFGPNAGHDGNVRQGDLANMALEDFLPIYARYDDLMPHKSPLDRRYAALTAEEYWIPNQVAAQAHARAGRPAWLYRFDMARDVAPNAGYSVHGSELTLVWDKLDDPYNGTLGPQGAAAARLSHVMHGHWVNFIHHGRPDPSLAPAWPQVGSDAPVTMQFDRNSRLVTDLDGAERRLWHDAPFDCT